MEAEEAALLLAGTAGAVGLAVSCGSLYRRSRRAREAKPPRVAAAPRRAAAWPRLLVECDPSLDARADKRFRKELD